MKVPIFLYSDFFLSRPYQSIVGLLHKNIQFYNSVISSVSLVFKSTNSPDIL